MSAWIGAALIVGGVIIHSVGELWQAAGGFEASNVLAPPEAIGQYLGVFGFGIALAESLGPALLTFSGIELGQPGWFLMGLISLVSGLAVPPVTRSAGRSRVQYAGIAVRETV
ncbi:hypothetical protein [Micromonospora sp. KC213]|uniref:hypothetical protein n=1 Tax=Micromonospora sp. KC213 TaxID=2530378 RepID=UPI00104C257D|nr:hypothetical protein [Micromonospora sp. KC213]TDC41315.1 hypothetical protein E1166_12140 [Micromonospora sp. KC213]